MVKYKLLDFMGYPMYRVGNDGSVWRLKKTVGWKRLKPQLARKEGVVRHLTVCFSINSVVKRFFVHRLVLLAFVGPCPEGMQCRHLDGNPKNNYLGNLCWGTPKEDGEDRVRIGTQLRGVQVKISKLNDDKVREARKLYGKGGNGWTYEKLANKYEVDLKTIYPAILGRTWSHVV